MPIRDERGTDHAAVGRPHRLAFVGGAALLALALGFASSAAALFAAIPASAVGALLPVAGTDLAVSKRPFDARLNCWPAIAIAAGTTAPLNPAVGLAAGWRWRRRGPSPRAFRHSPEAA